MQKMFEEKAFNGNIITIDYDQFRLGLQYRVKTKGGSYTPPVAFGTYGEAYQYARKCVTGGR